jgi:tetratricopeptide (TPR) repeat protein
MTLRPIQLSALFSILLISCGGLPTLRQTAFPPDCRKDQSVKELLKRGDTHRDLMMREITSSDIDEEQATQIRKSYGTKARTCYRFVLDTQRDNAYALLNTGFTYLIESTFAEQTPETRDTTLVMATNFVQQALDVQQFDAQSNYYLGEIAARRGQCDKALRIFNTLLASQWSYSHVYVWTGYCLELQGNWKEAKQSYQKAADLSNPVGIAEWARSRIR